MADEVATENVSTADEVVQRRLSTGRRHHLRGLVRRWDDVRPLVPPSRRGLPSRYTRARVATFSRTLEFDVFCAESSRRESERTASRLPCLLSCLAHRRSEVSGLASCLKHVCHEPQNQIA